MKHAGRILIAVLVVFVLGVLWYVTSGEAFVMRAVLTNDAGVAAGTTWVRSDKGLYGGPVTAIAALPSQPAVVYAGTREDDIYSSSNGGGLWVPLGGVSTGHYVAGIVVDAASVGKAVYGQGFFLSEDGGRTWRSANRGLRSRSLSCLASADDAPKVVFVGTGDTGLYGSRDGGRSWKRTGRALLGDRIACVTVSGDGRTVFAGTQDSGLFGSHDGGDTWTRVALPFGSQPLVTGVDIDPADEGRVVVCVTGSGAGVSSDGGKTWIRSRTNALPSDCAAIQFTSGDGTGLVAGTQSGGLWFSSDGVEWKVVHELPDGGHVFALARAGAGILAATSHGVFSSVDGMTWNESSTGITNLTLAGLAVSPTQPDKLFAATDEGVFRSLDAGGFWSRCSASERVLSVLVLPDGGIVLAGTAGGKVLWSADGGTNWISVMHGIPGMQVSSLATLPGKPGTVCAGTDDGFAISQNSGRTWEPRSISLAPTASAGSKTPRIEISALLADAEHPGTVFLSLAGHGLYVSSNEGSRWKSVQPGLSTPWVDSLAQDASAGTMYAGTDTDGVAVSHDGGTSWLPSGKGLSTVFSVSGAVNTLAVAADGTVYAGTVSRGVARSGDGGASWQRLNNGLPDIDVRHIIVVGASVFAVTAHCVVQLSSQ
jgi:photosystem II stability/assembly factor-like uncharacterized protein